MRIRVPEGGTELIDQLKAEGETVLRTESCGMAGTLYHMSCGCVRSYSVNFIAPWQDDAVTERLFPCEKHKALGTQ